MESVVFTTVIGDDGVIRAPSGTVLPHGTVQVVVRARDMEQGEADLTFGWLLPMAREAELGKPQLPSDLAKQHDHYAHGKPKP